MTFGEYIKQQRTKRQWTQPQAAQIIGIEQSYLSKLEAGKSTPTDEVFSKLLEAFGLSVEDVCSQLDKEESRRFKDIELVKQYVITNKQRETLITKRWLVASFVFFALAAASAALTVISSQKVYKTSYVSHGVLLEREAIDTFEILEKDGPSLQMYAARRPGWKLMSEQEQKQFLLALIDKQKALAKRADKRLLVLSDSLQGDYVIENSAEGKRVYWETDKDYVKRFQNGFWFLIPSFVFTIMGLTSIYFSYRWKQ